jgi:hypothetical protein
MNRTLTALGTSALLGGSLLLGAVPAQAVDMPPCPPKTHLVMDPGSTVSGECVHDPQPAPTAPIASGNNWSIWAGTPTYASGPAPQAPPAPARQAAVTPPRAVQVPYGDAGPGSVAAGGSRSGPNWAPAAAVAGTAEAPAGETLQSQTPVAGQAPVQVKTPAATVMPVTEVQAVAALRSGTATAAEKTAALVIVKARIDTVLSKALANARAGH